ncbi:MAG: DUF5681 domain-containing protein [Xanthobacteraceae bacterium]
MGTIENNRKSTMPFKPGQSGNPKGRANGSQNKIPKALKEAILQALEEAGGEGGSVEYLTWLAKTNSSAFASLLGKVLPMTIADTGQNEETRYVVTTSIVWPEDKDGNIVYPSWWEGEKKVIPASSLSYPAGGSRRDQSDQG